MASSERILESRVNTFTYSTQHEQALDIAEDGRILVGWSSRRQEVGSYGVFAQLLDGLGRPLGTELHINQYMPGAQKDPAVAFAGNGDAYMAWTSVSDQDGDAAGIYLRRLSQLAQAEGANHFGPVGDEIRVNQTGLGSQFDPSMEVLSNGNLVVSWLSDHNGTTQAFARLLDKDGQPLTDEFRLSAGEGQDAMPAVAEIDGGFVAVWAQTEADQKTPQGIYARSYNAEGKAGETKLVAGNGAIEPSIDSNGTEFALAWMSKDGDGYLVQSQRFNAKAEAVGDVWTAPQAAEGHYLNGAAVTMAPDGRQLVAFNQHQPSTINENNRRLRHVSIMGQRFDAAGNAVGEIERLNQNDQGVQDLRVGKNAKHLVWSAQDQIAMTWYGNTENDGKGIGLTLMVPEALEVAAAPVIEPKAALEHLKLADVQNQIAPPEWDPNWDPTAKHAPRGPAGPDFGFDGFPSGTGWNPPDPDLAVGTNHVVVVANVDMKFYDKSGTNTFTTGLESWFGTTGFVFDPVALYDQDVDRYVVAAVEHYGSGDYFNIAVSDDGDPNGSWHKYRFNVSSICGFIDFPNLGVSQDAYFLVADCFGGGGNNVHVMDKSAMLSGSPVSLTSVNTTGGIISNGATRNYDAEGTGYFASSYASGSPRLRLYAISDPTGSATLNSYDINVGSFSNPPDAAQLGTSNRADTIDHRIKNGVKRNGILYLCHNVANGGVAKVRWYKINLNGWPSGGTPTLLDSGYVDPGSGIYTWFGDVNVDAAGNMAIAYNQSSSSQYIGVNRAWRLAGDPAGTLQDYQEMQLSTSPETGSRWGDYAGLEEDPVAPGSFWSHHEYRVSGWRTWVGNFEVGGGYELTLGVSSPLTSGSVNSALTAGSDPFTPVHLYNGSGFGSSTTPYGVLEISGASKLITKNSNASGVASFSKWVRPALSGFTVYLQCIDSDGKISPVHTETIL